MEDYIFLIESIVLLLAVHCLSSSYGRKVKFILTLEIKNQCGLKSYTQFSSIVS